MIFIVLRGCGLQIRLKLEKLSKTHNSFDCPDFVGAVDCAHWEWGNYSTAWQGNYKGKEHKPVLRMAVVCDNSSEIWHATPGIPGS